MVKEIAGAIKEGLKAYSQWQKSREKRRYKKCIDAGEQYIRCHRLEGEYKEIKAKEKKKLLSKFEKRFFKYNQG